MDVSASPVHNQVHQEQISAEQEKIERVQQHTVDQIVHVPIPQSQELNMEGVKDIPQERFLQQTVWQIENATPAPALNMFPHEQFDEACRILDLKQSRKADLRAQRLDLYTDISSQEEYESGKAILENIQQELRAFRALRPPVKTSEASSSTLKLSIGPEEKTEAETLKS